MIIHIQTRTKEYNYSDIEISVTMTNGFIYINHTGLGTFLTIPINDVLVYDVRSYQYDHFKQMKGNLIKGVRK